MAQLKNDKLVLRIDLNQTEKEDAVWTQELAHKVADEVLLART
jgi:hypothetical protein